jgi:YafQ family addiction module toxin component
MYSIIIKSSLDKILKKLFNKNREQYEMLIKKVDEISNCDSDSINHYKNLKFPMNHLKRVHIMKSFVLTFSVDEKNKTITLEDYDHHDNIYKN